MNTIRPYAFAMPIVLVAALGACNRNDAPADTARAATPARDTTPAAAPAPESAPAPAPAVERARRRPAPTSCATSGESGAVDCQPGTQVGR